MQYIKPKRAHLIQNNDIVGSLEEVDLMSDKDARAPAQVAVDAAFEQLTTHVSVHGGQRIVQEVDISLDSYLL